MSKILAVRVTVLSQDDDGKVNLQDIVDFRDDGPGREIALSFSHRRTMDPMFEVGSDVATGIRVHGPVQFTMNVTHNGPPEEHPAPGMRPFTKEETAEFRRWLGGKG